MNNIDKDTQERVRQWLGEGYDAETVAQVQRLVDNKEDTEIIDSFYKELEFGTGGMRGIMGVGTNRMNRYTLGKATQGFANYLKKQFPDSDLKVAVSYDSRNNSPDFGRLVADVFSANGIRVCLFAELRPTPMLSFAVRHFGCHGGVMLTASHNPKEYNGYKAYGSDGGQLVAPHDKNVIAEVNAIRSVSEVRFDGNKANISLVGEDFDDIYIAANKRLSIRPEAVAAQKDLKIVYSSIHGTGITVVPKMLKAWGFRNVSTVAEQAVPDGNFPTVIYPNPEEEDAMAMAVRRGRECDAEVVMATDPDADRVGVAVKDHTGDFRLLNGNQIGSLLTYYVLSAKEEKGELKKGDYIVKTIVTSRLLSDIATSFGVHRYEVLTGFKYIGEIMTERAGKETYLVGGEESYGFLVGDLVRDKDAVNSCAFIAEMAAYFKQQGKSLFDILLALYVRYGFYSEKLISLTKKGKAGADEIREMMAGLRADPPRTLGGIPVREIRDYQSSEVTELATGIRIVINLPKSDVLQFVTKDGDVISARPSGTEPKIKFYCSVRGELSAPAEYEAVAAALEKKTENIMAFFN